MRPKTWVQWGFYHFVFGFVCSVETVCGHELIHQREWYNKALGTWTFTKLFYTHFRDEHVQVHHKIIGTYDDACTSRKNEPVWCYNFREVISTHVSQWRVEIQRIKRHHGRDCPWYYFLVFNKMTWYFIMHVSICVIIYLLLGWNSLKHHFQYWFVGINYVCFANYITHYGLTRNKDKNGLYESINKYHSWNFASSPLFFRMMRHSDHHMASFRPY